MELKGKLSDFNMNINALPQSPWVLKGRKHARVQSCPSTLKLSEKLKSTKKSRAPNQVKKLTFNLLLH